MARSLSCRIFKFIVFFACPNMGKRLQERLLHLENWISDVETLTTRGSRAKTVMPLTRACQGCGVETCNFINFDTTGKEGVSMTKTACIDFFEKFLLEVSKGHGYREHENPAVRFSDDVKAGKYNKYTDEGYSFLLQETKDMSAFWLNQQKQTASDVLRVALENIDIDKESLHKMAEILSECYSSSVASFVSEELLQNPETTEEKDKVEKDKVESDFEERSWSEESSQPAMIKKERRQSIREALAEERKNNFAQIQSPQEIANYLSGRIYGQKEAVRAAAMLLYNHVRGRKRNVLFIGQTGSGKTEIWRVCQQLYPNIRIIDSTVITGEGWSGSFKVNNIFDNMSRKDAQEAIIVFDEFDKLCEPKIGSGGTNHSFTIQNELLKLIEGTTVRLKNFSVNTSKISFVFCGSFEHLTEMKTDSESGKAIGFGGNPQKKEAHLVYENTLQPADFVKYAGMRQEIAGRINQIVRLSPMTAEAYKEILNDDQISPLHQLERQYGIKLSLDRETEQKLVQEAEATRMGVRYLHSRIQQMLDEQIFQDCGQTEYMLSA